MPHRSHALLLVAGNGPQDFIILLLLKHVAHPDGVHHHVAVFTQVLEQVFVVPRVKPPVGDHHHRDLGSGSLAVSDEIVIGKLKGRRRERAPGDPLQPLHRRFEGRHGIYVGVIEPNGLKGPVVTELHHSSSGS